MTASLSCIGCSETQQFTVIMASFQLYNTKHEHNLFTVVCAFMNCQNNDTRNSFYATNTKQNIARINVNHGTRLIPCSVQNMSA